MKIYCLQSYQKSHFLLKLKGPLFYSKVLTDVAHSLEYSRARLFGNTDLSNFNLQWDSSC